jgi:formylglycine-generating enzyme required for sulfatase activity
MIYVEGGTFTMGASPEQHKYLQKNWYSKKGKGDLIYNMYGGEIFDDEYPAHKVSLDSYFIGETEVSQELFEKNITRLTN